MSSKTASKYLSYLVRLWREDSSSSWRASVQNPLTGERRSFPNLALLLRFLEEQTGEAWGESGEEDGDGGSE